MQKTITFNSEVTGIAINGKYHSKVVFEPAEPNTGIVFIRDDLLGKPEIECRAEYASAQKRWTTLVKNGVNIEHTEHILAAIAGLEITNIRIHLNCPYVPVMKDFSSWGFMEALLKARPITQHNPTKIKVIKEPIFILDHFEMDGNRYDSLLIGLPAKEFSISYLLEYPNKKIPTQVAHFTTKGDFSSIAKARSFILDDEYDSMIQLLGDTLKNCISIPSSNKMLQWNNEIARHKVLDLLGDLMLTGQQIKGHFFGFRSGHKMNIKMSRLVN